MREMRGSSVAVAAAVLFSMTVGCTPKPTPGTAKPPEGVKHVPLASAPAATTAVPVGATATAELQALGGSGVTGTVTFTESAGTVHIEAHVAGLKPGQHGFHIHEKGECSGDGSGAGPHFNPDAMKHGSPDSMTSHEGDMGNLTADASGNGILTLMSRRITLSDGPNSIIGRSVVIHGNPDDLTTDPAGNSGPRIACGVIKSTGGGEPAMATPAGGSAPAAQPSGPSH